MNVIGAMADELEVLEKRYAAIAKELQDEAMSWPDVASAPMGVVYGYDEGYPIFMLYVMLRGKKLENNLVIHGKSAMQSVPLQVLEMQRSPDEFLRFLLTKMKEALYA